MYYDNTETPAKMIAATMTEIPWSAPSLQIQLDVFSALQKLKYSERLSVLAADLVATLSMVEDVFRIYTERFGIGSASRIAEGKAIDSISDVSMRRLPDQIIEDKVVQRVCELSPFQ